MDIMNDVDLRILTCNDILMENRFVVCLKFAFSPFPVIHFLKRFSNLPIFHSKQSIIIIILQFILLIAIIYSRVENKKQKLPE